MLVEQANDWQSWLNARGNTANSKNESMSWGYLELSALGANLRAFPLQFNSQSDNKMGEKDRK